MFEPDRADGAFMAPLVETRYGKDRVCSKTVDGVQVGRVDLKSSVAMVEIEEFADALIEYCERKVTAGVVTLITKRHPGDYA